MEKCWFVLRQSHYPPPTIPKSSKEQSTGAICLGHVIQDLRHIDQVLNSDGPRPYPRSMPPYFTQKRSFAWNDKKDDTFEASLGVRVPIQASPVSAQVSSAFKHSKENYWEFDALDTCIIQPTPAYTTGSLAVEPLKTLIEDKKRFGVSSWSLFMITGLVIARGAKSTQHGDSTAGAQANAGVHVDGLADVTANANAGTRSSTTVSYQEASDFVWAVRLCRLSKGLFDSKLKHETFIKGATFSIVDEDDTTAELEELFIENSLDARKDCSTFEGSEGEVFVVVDAASGQSPMDGQTRDRASEDLSSD